MTKNKSYLVIAYIYLYTNNAAIKLLRLSIFFQVYLNNHTLFGGGSNSDVSLKGHPVRAQGCEKRFELLIVLMMKVSAHQSPDWTQSNENEHRYFTKEASL